MKLTLPDYSTARVVVAGDLMLDRYWQGPTSRISPEAPVPVVKVEQLDDRPGGAANVALNLAALTVHTELLGMTGKDEAADALGTALSGVGIATHFQQVGHCPTITKLRVLSRHQQLIRLDFEDNFAEVDASPLLADFETAIQGAGIAILSDYAKGALSQVSEMIAIAKRNGIPVLVDPKGSEFEKYRGATLMTPNLSEFELVVGCCNTEQELVEKAHALRQELELDALLVTRGEQGMTLITADQAELHLPAVVKEVYDVTGAGDTVISVLAASLAAGASMPASCALANIAAGIVVGKLGTSTVSQMELAQAIAEQSESGFGVVTEEQLRFAVVQAAARGEKIVMTNGCFDILHAGHVSYLQAARALGHRLIVAVNADDSVARLKGPGRPVNPLERRMAVLAALGDVDWVVPFTEDTPARLIGEVLPNVLVKGGDYTPEQIAGADAVWDNGGEVTVLHFEDGCSTTQIIDRIRQQNQD
ncbi:bifunctional D-glycero-beta-D-manno-heptose-7-phosphate kinase/D-glycero-beta-D-manno-heptose 1-phosphate adenylyltransferase HldE [Echinimonas agarilytica]|uniref:Bifunctional protein HldE n=1 Tax=Echinimonas agarilytica TaxID=1215918 RepID=A0AA41W7F2_9GAMM|nr:bifunctional D-glycero-beta-D-manno-heptose-7-phosphate kinase/D-glycero-beta-D-manno-heptose 1-phosphate adenylyltransferase HldE [Echinimonas agarilytica]MCM2680389.1 bifunctional D-glycero-beta-D-manno-heptose-7-phosphate kinase/D-glycero-beta-D-manno-heptose 1-phosphate adenylyltransferase HldE [Echinimonas agarilytica]